MHEMVSFIHTNALYLMMLGNKILKPVQQWEAKTQSFSLHWIK